jgi:hypothetical protein
MPTELSRSTYSSPELLLFTVLLFLHFMFPLTPLNHAGGHWLLTAEAQLRLQASPFGIRGGEG